VEIRVLTETDAVRWRDLRLRMLREHPDAFGTSYEEALASPLETYAQRLRDPERWTLGALEGEQLLGSVGLRREAGAKDRHKAMIWGMYTAPEARGRGIGKALLGEAIARARAMPGLEQIGLAVTTHNTAARNLYTSLGFQTYGLERHALKLGDRYLDEELMVLWLIAPPA
jgi:ribosomal protein S18 acetylase RimI-like enzyme